MSLLFQTILVLVMLAPLNFLSAQNVSLSASDTMVALAYEHRVELPENRGLGFRISVSGWSPNGTLSIYAVGTKGEKVPIIPLEDKVRVSPEGTATFSVHYELKGLHLGHWSILVGGTSGAHIFQMKIPKIERPTPDHSTWILNFEAADDYEKSVTAAEKS